MDENIKLLIELPKWYYEELKTFIHPTMIDKAIINGVPADQIGKKLSEGAKEILENLEKQMNVILYDLVAENESLEEQIEALRRENGTT